MVRLRQTAETVLLLIAGCVYASLYGHAQQPPPPHASGSVSAKPVASAGAPQAKPQHSQANHKKKPEPVAEAPTTPPPPPTLEQQPPTPPQVTYRDGLLSISATNSTLSQVLQSVQSKTGAVVDIPAGGGSERVVTTIGPGKPQTVLATLLNGSKFNYVILGEPNNPGAVQKVILLAKSNAPGDQSAMAQNNVRSQPTPQAVEPPEDEYPQNEPEIDQSQQQPANENPPTEVVNPGNRTPEEMLQELQRMQEQQQQMQQQLNPSNRQPFGQPFNSNTPQPPASTPFPSSPQPPQQPQ